MNDRFPFLVAAFVYLMDQYKQLGMVPPEEEQDEEKTSGNEVGETAFESWLKPLTPGTFNNGVMNICVPTRFMRNWVITHYSERIHKIWEKKNPAIREVNFVVQAMQESGVATAGTGMYTPSCRSLLKKIS